MSITPVQISMAVFCAIDEFLKSCSRFWLHPCKYYESFMYDFYFAYISS